MKILWGQEIRMRDGVILIADLFLPEVERTFPALVVRTPYGRQAENLNQQANFFASHGYAVVNVDVRGRGDSDGKFEPYRNEGKDGYDTIEWVAAQSWCDENVGTIGGSYLGKVQWLTALEKPPHLKAMIPLVSPSDPFVEWPTGSPTPSHLCWLFLTSGRQVQNIHAVDWQTIYEHLPLLTMDHAAGRSIPAWREEFEHTLLDDWWLKVCYQSRLDEIDLPVLHISGWYDDEEIGTPLNFSRMADHAKHQRLIMGPWEHRVNISKKIGDIDFGPQAVIDLYAEELRFFDRWLKNISNGIDMEDPVRIFVMGKNEWRNERGWPLSRTNFTRWYLQSDGKLNVCKPEIGEAFDSYTYDPKNPTPFLTKPTSEQIGGPDDYRKVHEQDDILVYTSDVLQEPLEVTGPINIELFAKTSAKDTDFMAMLFDVWPNGFVQRLCDGMVRARFRNGIDHEDFVEPGAIEEYKINLWDTSHVFLPGHKVRVHIASSAFPKYDRNLNTGDRFADSVEVVCAKQTIFHDKDHSSAIILPVINYPK